jgi:BlaI family transcriptional regulator, penicillinase repressor
LSRKKSNNLQSLTRREREIMDALYKLGAGTVAEIQAILAYESHYSTVRAELSILKRKGHVRHHERNLRYVYTPVLPKAQAGLTALQHVRETFFDGSTETLLIALLGELAPEELEHVLHKLETFK